MPDETPTPSPIYVPVPSDRAWFDPRLMLAACEFQVEDFTLVANTNTRVAVADPRRVAIGFTLPPGVVVAVAVGPWPDVVNSGYGVTGTATGTWFTVREHLVLPCIEWSAWSFGGGPVRVTTIRRT